MTAKPSPVGIQVGATEANASVKQLVDKFLAWPLPESVCPDLCTNVTREQYPHPRIGTMLLTAIEAEQMIRYLGLYPCPCHPAIKQGVRSHEVELRCSKLNGCKNIMDEIKEHTNAAQGEDAYLRIYPCDAREILKRSVNADEATEIYKWARFVVKTLKRAPRGSLGATGPKSNRHSMVLEILGRYDALKSAVSPKAGPHACEWSPQNDWENDSDDRWWNTGCGSEYILNAGNVPGREFSYCPYCGGEASPPAVSVGEQEKERE